MVDILFKITMIPSNDRSLQIFIQFCEIHIQILILIKYISLSYLSKNNFLMPHPILLHLLTIPKGKVTTYKALGQKFAMHPRAVARVLAGNREQDLYPCYKVVHSDGKIG